MAPQVLVQIARRPERVITVRIIALERFHVGVDANVSRQIARAREGAITVRTHFALLLRVDAHHVRPQTVAIRYPLVANRARVFAVRIRFGRMDHLLYEVVQLFFTHIRFVQ